MASAGSAIATDDGIVLEDLQCPVSLELLKEPYIHVLCSRTFSLASLQRIISMRGNCPMCRGILNSSNITPNIRMQQVLDMLEKSKSRAASAIAGGYGGAQSPPMDKSPVMAQMRISAAVDTVKNVTYVTIDSTKCIEQKRTPIHQVALKDSSGATECHGYTRLDLAKHALNTCCNTLAPDDLFTLCTFNHATTVIYDAIHIVSATAADMPAQGVGKMVLVSEVMKTINRLRPDGATNIWDALRCAFDSNNRHKSYINTHILLFTDGNASQVPLGGFQLALSNMKTKHAALTGNSFNCTISTIGFSNDINSVLLSEIAAIGGGTFCYISDASFVGTVCVNLFANILAADITQCSSLEITRTTADPAVLAISEIACNIITRWDYRIFIMDNASTIVRIRFMSNWHVARDIPLVAMQPTAAAATADDEDVQATAMFYEYARYNEYARHGFLSIVTALIAAKGHTEATMQSLAEFIDIYNAKSHYIDALLHDLTTEIELAARSVYFGVWGEHYLRSLIFAHSMRLRNNFKDASTQFYSVGLGTMRDAINDIFNELPAPQPSYVVPRYAASVTAPYATIYNSTVVPSPLVVGGHGGAQLPPVVSLAHYNRTSNGCFARNSIVFHAKSPDPLKHILYPVEVNKLQVGDYIASDSSGYVLSRISHITVQHNQWPIQMVKFASGLIITPWHPVQINKKWYFPSNLVPTLDREPDIHLSKEDTPEFVEYDEEVYNIALEDGDYAYIQGMIVITLGHMIIDDPVASHPYFGSYAVIQDLKKLPLNASGHRIVNPDCIKRNTETQIIVGMGGTAPIEG
jgi:hypothetical protein